MRAMQELAAKKRVQAQEEDAKKQLEHRRQEAEDLKAKAIAEEKRIHDEAMKHHAEEEDGRLAELKRKHDYMEMRRMEVAEMMEALKKRIAAAKAALAA